MPNGVLHNLVMQTEQVHIHPTRQHVCERQWDTEVHKKGSAPLGRAHNAQNCRRCMLARCRRHVYPLPTKRGNGNREQVLGRNARHKSCYPNMNHA